MQYNDEWGNQPRNKQGKDSRNRKLQRQNKRQQG